MADVNPNDIVRTALRQTLDGRSQVVNVCHLKYTGGTGLTADEVLADCQAFWDGLLDILEPFQGISLVYDEVYSYNETQATPIGTIDVGAHANGSENTAVIMPHQTAGGLYGLTHLSRVIGKKFFGGFTELHNIQSGALSSSLIAALASIAAYIWDSSQTYNAHDYQGGVWRKLTNTLVPVMSAFVGNTWYIQRRRRPGVGA